MALPFDALQAVGGAVAGFGADTITSTFSSLISAINPLNAIGSVPILSPIMQDTAKRFTELRTSQDETSEVNEKGVDATEDVVENTQEIPTFLERDTEILEEIKDGILQSVSFLSDIKDNTEAQLSKIAGNERLRKIQERNRENMEKLRAIEAEREEARRQKEVGPDMLETDSSSLGGSFLLPLLNLARIVKNFAGILGAVAAGFLAVKTFFSATLLPAVTALMVPLLPIIAIVAAISLALWSLWEAFSDAQDTFEETGSITEALKVGISKFFGTLIGFIPDLVLKLVGWVAGLFGFDDFKKKVQTINVTQWIADTIKGLFDDIHKWFTGLWSWAEATGAGIEGGWSLKTFISGIWTNVKEWFTKLFSWGTGVVTEGWTNLTTYISGIWDSVYGWFTGLWSWGTGVATKGWTNLTGFIKGVWDSVYGWFTGLWSWGAEKGKTPDGEAWSLTKMISDVFKSAKDWFVGLFTWKKVEPKEGEKQFSVAQLLLDLWEDIKTALSSIFPSLSDLKELLPSFSDVKNTVKGWLGFGDSSKISSASDFDIPDFESVSSKISSVFDFDIPDFDSISSKISSLFDFETPTPTLAPATAAISQGSENIVASTGFPPPPPAPAFIDNSKNISSVSSVTHNIPKNPQNNDGTIQRLSHGFLSGS